MYSEICTKDCHFIIYEKNPVDIPGLTSAVPSTPISLSPPGRVSKTS